MTDAAVPAHASELAEAWQSHRSMGWRFARLLAEAHAENAAAVLTWCEDVLKLDPSTAYKYIRAGKWIMGLAEPLRQKLRLLPIANAFEVLPLAKDQPAEAVELAVEHKTQSAIREAVKRAQPDQHHDVSGYRTIKATVSEATLRDWQRMVNVLRAHLGTQGTAKASDDQLITAVAQTVLQAPELHVPEHYRIDVESGTCACAICGSWSHLERHHLQPRSMGGHEGPLAWLCSDCHRGITENRDGHGWRWLLEKLGHAEIAAQWEAQP
jgi:hypothetical protein